MSEKEYLLLDISFRNFVISSFAFLILGFAINYHLYLRKIITIKSIIQRELRIKELKDKLKEMEKGK
ncbi:MAG: hypothetical protein HZA00_13415 [Nitrospinae bacterium]|nr:hypothetical protein [Nitrospinota bacterium]